MIRKRVIVAMSGGVDSSVAAALLKQENYEVIGLTLQMLDDSPGFSNSTDQIESAGEAARSLGISHQVLDIREIFREKIIKHFVDEYRRGRTPNPCVICNRQVKFAALCRQARDWGADYLATGHYARVEYSASENRYLLRKGVDSRKDQSYMLFNLTQEQLSQCLFPLGNLNKLQVFSMARQFNFHTAGQKESQEICFVPGNDYREFLSRRGLASLPGPIIDRDGRRLGTHQGITGYTVGQRRGLGLSSPEPLYVLEIRPEDNILVVGKKEELFQAAVEVEFFNYVSAGSLKAGQDAKIKIRYRSPEVPARLEQVDGSGFVKAVFENPQPAVTPGQAAVFYEEDLVLGGGIIRASPH